MGRNELSKLSHGRRRWLATGALAGLSVAGCTFSVDADYAASDAPAPRGIEPTAADGLRTGSARVPTVPAQRAGVALVLGSGGPRGFVHAGVLAALDELGVKPILVVGSSIGSLVGALYASGMGGAEIRERAMAISFTDLAVLALGANERFSGAPLANWVNTMVGARRIEQLATPFAAVAFNRDRSALVAFERGNTGIAVQASCAVSGSFTPVRIRGERFIDPDASAPLPVRLARSLGAQRVFSVDPSAHEDKPPPGAERFADGDRRKRETIAPDAKSADVNLHPYFGYWVSLTSEFRQRAIQAGYDDTMANAARIKALWAQE
jgi:NTE family protein